MTSLRETERAGASDKRKDRRARNTIKIATYNVRTLNDCGKIEQLISGCEKFNISVVAIQEHRQIIEEEIKYEWTSNRKWLRVFSSATKQSTGGVGLLLEAKIANALQSVTKVSDRIIVASIDGNPRMIIVAVYGPTNGNGLNGDKLEKSLSEKQKFATDLRNALDKIPAHNVLIVLGDFNARIGEDSHSIYPHIIGPYAYHQDTNDNGQRLIDICETHKLRPAFSRFKHNRQRLWTWEHPDQTEKENQPKRYNFAQLDHVLINSKWVNSLRNCRAYSSINLESDHRIVCTKLTISLRTQQKLACKRLKFHCELLKDEATQIKYNIELRNKFSAL